jgi:hypothetical protein
MSTRACLGLVLVVALGCVAAAPTCQPLAAAERAQCDVNWQTAWNQEKCEYKGCCFAPSLETPVWCFYPEPLATNITTVHVVQGCHLDVGFLVRAQWSVSESERVSE